LKWSGLVEAKVRLLVASLETVESIALAHPFNKGKDRQHEDVSEEDEKRIISGELQYDSATKAVDLAEAETTKHNIYTSTFYIGLELDPNGSKQLDISYQIKDFINTCETWPGFDAELHHLAIVHTRNYDLPLDLFEEGESRPTRAPKKKKRTAEDARLGDSNGTAMRPRLTPVNSAATVITS
jgi:poly(A) polymerase